MNRYSFSPSRLAFYANELCETYYKPADSWPDDATDIDDSIADKYMILTPPVGKMLGVVDGKPAWVDVPPPTHEEHVAAAELKKQTLINQTNDYMASKQWPGKAAIGRLKGEGLEQYNLWLDYLDALELVDTASAPDIEWPTPPAVQAR
ncbi:tail fiber assembly protein [Escherichia coli]|uniref:tail fiber assembly protein n=1 Tax=Escherichia coli TaxID=562 RepID=UPI000BB70A39|nr:tail fiber assembly protein [Escherichia coli]PBT54276.1 tail fiber assembly protein [Escherichia coli]